MYDETPNVGDRRIKVKLKNTTAKKWMCVSSDGTMVVASTKEEHAEESKEDDLVHRKATVKGKEKEENGQPPHDVDGSPARRKGETRKDAHAQFGWSVVRPGSEESWATLTLVELFSELMAAHGFEEDRLSRLASLL